MNARLEGEMDAHLTSEERENGNRRNGKMCIKRSIATPSQPSLKTYSDTSGTAYSATLVLLSAP